MIVSKDPKLGQELESGCDRIFFPTVHMLVANFVSYVLL